jgi:hypothetical protein
MKHVISCFPNGTLEAVQNDEIPITEIGHSTMERASDVTWDEDSQVWVAVIRDKFRRQERSTHSFSSTSRTEAINWELKYLNNRRK